VYVLIDIHLKRWRNKVNQIRHNQVGLFLSSHASQQEENTQIAL